METSSSASVSVISATRRAYKELVDGTLRVQFDVDPKFKNDFLKLFPEIDMGAAIAPLIGYSGQAAPAKNYGQFAKALYQSIFCTQVEVWRQLGSDKEYRHWIQDQNCIVCGTRDYVEETGDMKCEAAHVRRSSTSGVAIKADYSCVPLCHHHHTQQHQHGESAIGGERFMLVQRDLLIKSWAWETLKVELGVQSMKQAEPQDVVDWATERNLQAFLP